MSRTKALQPHYAIGSGVAMFAAIGNFALLHKGVWAALVGTSTVATPVFIVVGILLIALACYWLSKHLKTEAKTGDQSITSEQGSPEVCAQNQPQHIPWTDIYLSLNSKKGPDPESKEFKDIFKQFIEQDDANNARCNLYSVPAFWKALSDINETELFEKVDCRWFWLQIVGTGKVSRRDVDEQYPNIPKSDSKNHTAQIAQKTYKPDFPPQPPGKNPIFNSAETPRELY